MSAQPVRHYPHTNHVDTNLEQLRAQSWDSDHMFTNASGIEIHGGRFSIGQTNVINRTSKGMDRLMEWIAPDAFYDSDELYDDVPECRPETRAVLNDMIVDIMQWVVESELVRDDFILWLFGPAGIGKTVIARKIAELAAEDKLLIAAFFFSRTSPSRSTKDRLVPTLAYQLALSIPETRIHIQDAIERDPAIFHKNIPTQMDALLIKPLQAAQFQINPIPKLIIIDGLDECKDSRVQVAILNAISHSFLKHSLPLMFIVVSRPELSLVNLFNRNVPLKSIHRRFLLQSIYSSPWLKKDIQTILILTNSCAFFFLL